jgi:hypothetical protein
LVKYNRHSIDIAWLIYYLSAFAGSFWGSWQTESLIISLVIFNLVLTWHISMKMGGHISWHKAKDKN